MRTLLLSSGALLFLALFALPLPDAHADLVFFKDGVVMQGKVVREKKTILDPASGQPVSLSEGFFLLETAARSILFSPAQVERAVDDKEFAVEVDTIKCGEKITYLMARPVPSIRQIIDVGEWDDNWDRMVKFNSFERAWTVKQHLSLLNPKYIQANSVSQPKVTQTIAWTAYYLPCELGVDQVKKLLATHPQLKLIAGLTEEQQTARRISRARFLSQCGWHEEAEEAYLQVLKDIPSQKEPVETALANLKKVRAAQLAQDLKTANQAGQFQWVQKRIGNVPEEGLTEKTLADLRALRLQYDDAGDKLKLARRYLAELPALVNNPEQRSLFQEAAAAISAELNADNLGRLKTFLDQAQQAERLAKDEKNAQPIAVPQAPHLLALAISGWLLGDASAENKIEVGQRLWRTRQVVLKYLQTANATERKKLLETYLDRKSDTVAVDEMGQLIGFLPPARADEKLAPGIHELSTGPAAGRPVNYTIQVPPEYSPSRLYPLLFVLHQSGEKPKDMLDRWADLAAKHGYLLVAPSWAQAPNAPYNYTPQEHATVLDVLVDVRKRFAVDSDRVFLAGHGQGGDMTYDVGLSHPDLFAGVIPMSAQPGPMPYRYRRNAQYLPVYAVAGDCAGDPRKDNNNDFFRDWIPSGYPMTYVVYKGRGLEWFSGELPNIFDWMARKERANPVAELGRPAAGGPVGDEFQTMRSTDNRFYWLSTDAIAGSHLNEGPSYKSTVLAALLQGNIGKGNHINVRVSGLKQVTVWLLRDRRGQVPVDFEKPIEVYLNSAVPIRRSAAPSLATMLEELYARGDRQRLAVARLDFDLK
jgi:pimeloyl-ACP methyl ester carboxylesterase